MFRYDTHVHTSQTSACAKNTGAELVRAYKEKGYTGIFITDHFLNGNTTVPVDLPWKERIDLFCKGYEDAKEEGDKIGLDVFFGFEYAFGTADFLVYNIDKKWLLANEDIDICNPAEAFEKMHQAGGFVVHAHPFRERYYISYIKLCPEWVDAVEVYNASHSLESVFDERARWYAESYNLPFTAGSDTHSVEQIRIGGFTCEERIKDGADYKRLVLQSKILLF